MLFFFTNGNYFGLSKGDRNSDVTLRVTWVRVYTVFSFFVTQFASLKTKNEHYIRFSFFYLP